MQIALFFTLTPSGSSSPRTAGGIKTDHDDEREKFFHLTAYFPIITKKLIS